MAWRGCRDGRWFCSRCARWVGRRYALCLFRYFRVQQHKLIRNAAASTALCGLWSGLNYTSVSVLYSHGAIASVVSFSEAGMSWNNLLRTICGQVAWRRHTGFV